jgi:hypothetical protein
MGSGQKRIQTTAENRSEEQWRRGVEAQERALNDPVFKARQARALSRQKSIKEGTLAENKEFRSNAAGVAERNRQYDARTNLANSGIAGLASNYADPNMVANAARQRKDEWTRDSAAQTEADANEFIRETDAMDRDNIAHAAAINSGIMNSAFGVSQNQQQTAAQIAATRASILPGMLGAVLGTAGQVGSAWFARK